MNVNRTELTNGKNLKQKEEEERKMEMEIRRGPWTGEEDMKLINYIALNGEGRWNSLACAAGLNRTGKSCRLRWLNYLRPDIRRGDITLQEQFIILELHSRWGNRWSKIAQHLPGRTDNEIKNYWRTRVEKHAKVLKCDVNSKRFKDTIKQLWLPLLAERIASSTQTTLPTATSMGSSFYSAHQLEYPTLDQMTNVGSNGGDALWSVDELNNWLLCDHNSFY